MALITRFSRLFTADLHALLDRLEAPEVVLKQAIREMEEEVANRAARVKRLDLEHQHMAQQLQEIEQSLRTVAEQLDVCFASSDELLARGLLKRRLQLERHAQRLGAKREVNRQMAAAERSCHDDNQRQLDGLRQQADVMLEALTTASDQPCESSFVDSPITDADVEIALLREKQQRRHR
jgi:phage shock protein A